MPDAHDPAGRYGRAQIALRRVAGHLSNPPLQADFAIGSLIFFVCQMVFTYGNFVLASGPYDLIAAQLGLVYFVCLPAS